MRLARALAVLGLVALAACGGSSSSPTATTSPSPAVPSAADNVLAVQVSSGPANNTINGLYASVTICVPGTTTCQTIDGVQVDTGSTGLRLLASQVSLPLPAVDDGAGHPVANCANFADNSFTWGPVMSADVQLAGEKAAAVPIQLIGAPGFPGAPAACSNGGTAADTVPALSARGLLGLGVFRQDCGPACSGGLASAPPVYFVCSSIPCVPTAVPLLNQLQNPVWRFPQDNNGLLVALPSVPATGSPALSGALVFGIGTQANNTLGSARVYATDFEGNFSTTFNGRVYSSSFLDTGSNGLYFLDAATIGLPACPGGDSGYSCPATTVNYTAVNAGSNGSSAQLAFSVANAEQLFRTNNDAFVNLAGPDTGEFDWGLPFFFGRPTFIGIEGQTSAAATGPYWAY